MTGRGVIAAVTALAVVCAACGAGWHRVPQVEPGPLAPRQQVQVWSSRGVLRWHAVQIGPDSLSGIPFARPINCDSCRTALPRAAVDSIWFGNPEGGFWKTMGLVIGVPTLIMIIVCGSSRYGCIPTN